MGEFTHTLLEYTLHSGAFSIMAITARAIPAEPYGKKREKKKIIWYKRGEDYKVELSLPRIYFEAFPELLQLQRQPQQDKKLYFLI